MLAETGGKRQQGEKRQNTACFTVCVEFQGITVANLQQFKLAPGNLTYSLAPSMRLLQKLH